MGYWWVSERLSLVDWKECGRGRSWVGLENSSNDVVFLLLGDYQAPEFYVPTFRNTIPS
jgi:hypothetical protein